MDVINHELSGSIDSEIREVDLHPDVFTNNFHLARHEVYVIIAGASGEDLEEIDSTVNPFVNPDDLTRGSMRRAAPKGGKECEGDANRDGANGPRGETECKFRFGKKLGKRRGKP
jgi:hypothetical protein